MCYGQVFNPPKPPALPPVPATPAPEAVFGQRISLDATMASTQPGTAPSARSASSFYVPVRG